MKHPFIGGVAASVIIATPVLATEISIGPAPDGDPALVAQQIILENFDPPDCPQITGATRLADGSIKALCSNGETFRVFYVRNIQKNIAMRCSVLAALGIPEC